MNHVSKGSDDISYGCSFCLFLLTEQEAVITALRAQSVALDHRGFFIIVVTSCLILCVASFYYFTPLINNISSFTLFPPSVSPLPALPLRTITFFCLTGALLSLVANFVLSLQEPIPSPTTPPNASTRPHLSRALSLPPEMAHTLPHLKLSPLLPVSFLPSFFITIMTIYQWYKSTINSHDTLNWIFPTASIGLAWLARRVIEGSQTEIESLERLKYAFKGYVNSSFRSLPCSLELI